VSKLGELRKIGKFIYVAKSKDSHYIHNKDLEHLGDIGKRWNKSVISIGDLDFDSVCLRDIAKYLEFLDVLNKGE